jgi:hypothetical protein
MSKQFSKAYLEDKKHKTFQSAMVHMLAFEASAGEIMHKGKNLAPSELLKGSMEDIKRAEQFWIHMRKAAEEFLKTPGN